MSDEIIDKPEEQTPQPPVEPKPTEPKETVADIDDMSADEILNGKVTDKPEDKPEEKKPAEPVEPEKKDDDPRVSVGKDEQGNPLYYNDSGELVTGDRLKDTQAALTRSQQMLKEVTEQLQQYKSAAQADKFKDFVELTEQEIAELKETDPDELSAYEKEHAEYTEFVREKVEQTARAQWLTILDAATEILNSRGEKVDIDPAQPFNQQPAVVQKFLVEEIRKSVDPFVVKNYKRNEDGLFTKDQIIAAHRQVFFNDYVNKEKVGLREQVLTDIQKAGGNPNPNDRIPKAAGGDSKPLDKLSLDEINSLSPDEVDYYFEQQGMK